MTSEVLEVELTAMAHGGSALGRYEGRVIFVPYSIPGERVRVEIVKSHPRWAGARLLEVVEPSAHRVEPPCPHFGPGRCGGCHFQHIDYQAQAEFKRQVVVDQMNRLGRLPDAPVCDIIAAAEPWGYRNHAQFSVTTEGKLGFVGANTFRSADATGTDGLPVVPVQECLILDPLLDDLWAALDMEWPQLHRLSLRCGSATGDLMAVFELDHYEDFDIEVDFPVSCVLLLADGEVVVLLGHPHYFEHVAGRDYRVSAGSFFQVNTGGAEALVSLVREGLPQTPGNTVVDLYSGVGLFTLALADRAGRVVGVEAAASAAADFRHNARDMEHVQLVEDTVHSALAQIQGPVDALVLDPPRSGAGREVMRDISRLSPERVVYVSCDPATLARDARILVEGGYELQEVQPLDLFPQTYHIETLALFSK